jgi:serralysin
MPIFTGTGGNDTIVGGPGPDTLIGLAGDDSYVVDDAGDEIVEADNEGYDIVYAAVSYVLSAGAWVEVLATVDNFATTAINLTGNERDNYVTGNAGANILDGGTGSDYLWGREGNDSYFVDADDTLLEYVGQGFDVVYARSSYVLGAGLSIEALRTADDIASSAINLTGNEFGQLIVGNAGINILRGGGGADTLEGLNGDDSYFVDGDDIVTEASGQGNDIVYASASFSLGAGSSIETLATIDNLATTAINLTGNELANYLVGNAGANVLDGAGSGDLMEGRQGDDTYIASMSDIIIEKAGEGHDILYFSIVVPSQLSRNYTLGAGVSIEELRIADHLASEQINLTGNEFGQLIVGNGMGNLINGGGGADVFQGMGGDDVYFPDADDVIIEAVGEGADVLLTRVSYVLNAGASVEFMSAQAGIHLTGNELAQVITGHDGMADVLRGGGGADTLRGRDGNDTYFVDSDDIVEEDSTGGSDIVYAESSFVLTSANVEILATVNNFATTAINLTGSAGNQYITGNAGANRIDGGGGSDYMWGREGDDEYVHVSANDIVVEHDGQGFDTLYADGSFQLDAIVSIEALRAFDPAGTTAINLTGNGFGQLVSGNAGANRIDGGGGADNLEGLGGVDLFLFTTALGGGNIDTILDYQAGLENIYLDDAVFTGLAPGALSAGAFRTGTTAQDADDRILYDTTTGALYFDSDGVGGNAAVQFAIVTGAPTLSALDFTVI